jgi:hypothetical protein
VLERLPRKIETNRRGPCDELTTFSSMSNAS